LIPADSRGSKVSGEILGKSKCSARFSRVKEMPPELVRLILIVFQVVRRRLPASINPALNLWVGFAVVSCQP
jgi:hypothetical protein